MRLIDLNWHPTDRQLRQFGLLAMAALPALAWWWGGARVQVIVPAAAVGAGLALAALFRPQWLRPVYLGLCLVGWPIGVVVGELALLAIYLGVITPLGCLRRWSGRRDVPRGPEPGAASYWQDKASSADPRGYYKQW